MPLTITTISEIARRLALEQGRALDVAVMSTHGGSDRVELLVTIADQRYRRSRFLLNVTRADRLEFERELKGRLAQALHAESAVR